jgi:hypothetical protein
MTTSRLAGIVSASLLLAFTLLSSGHRLFAQSDAKISVAAAERTKVFGLSGMPGSVSESDDKTVLVLALNGISNDKWDKLNPDSFFLTAGESRHDCIVKMSGKAGADGKARPDYRLVFRVPKVTTSFVLHYEKASVPFSVTGSIKENIR